MLFATRNNFLQISPLFKARNQENGFFKLFSFRRAKEKFSRSIRGLGICLIHTLTAYWFKMILD